MSGKTVGSPIPLEELRQASKNVFGKLPCLWQLRVAEAILQRKKDVILTAATGAGKTLTFWLPLLAKPDSIQIVCAPLNILGTINVHALAEHGIRAITVTAENASPAIFRVRHVMTRFFCNWIQITDYRTSPTYIIVSYSPT